MAIAYPCLDLEVEKSRLDDVRSYEVIGSLPDAGLDRITAFAADMFDVPLSIVTFIDETLQWFVSAFGTEDRCTDREVAFCNYVISCREPVVVLNALTDKRFVNNPVVTGPMTVRFYAGAPLISAAGHVLGSLCLIDTEPHLSFSTRDMRRLETLVGMVMSELELRREVLKRERIAEELSQSEAKLRMSLEVGQMVAWSHDLASGHFSAMGPMADLWGDNSLTRDTSYERIRQTLHDDDKQRIDEVLDQAKRTKEPFKVDFRVTDYKGRLRWLESRGQFTDLGPGGSSFGITYDVTRPREESEERELLMRELRHRMQNLFATINAIITLSRRAATNIDDYIDRVQTRLLALSRAQRVLLDQDFSTGSFEHLIHELTAVYPRIVASGEIVTLNDRQLISLSLVLTELATNAIKYGSLAHPDGSVELNWEQLLDRGNPALKVIWKEVTSTEILSAEPLKNSLGTGFGTQLMDRAIVQNLHGNIERDWQSGSLCCTIVIPLI